MKHLFFLFVSLALYQPFTAPPALAVLNNGANAENLLGQSDDLVTGTILNYTKAAAHNAPHAYGIANNVTDIEIDTINHRLFVSDSTNNRVLVFNLATDNTLTDYGADFVLGQPNFSSNTAATTQAGMSSPQGLAYDATNNRLFVAEQSNARVLVFDVAAITNGENAVNVLGQANFVTSSGFTTQSGTPSAFGLAYDATNNRLFVSQQNINRVTVFDVASITNGENATHVLGQTFFTTFTSATTQSGMNYVRDVAYDSVNNRLFVADQDNRRVLVFDVAAITNGENAINVLGQANFTSSAAATTQAGMNGPYALAYDATNSRLFVGEQTNSRVTVFDVAAITDGENAQNVLGQPNFLSNGSAATQGGVSSVQGLGYDSSNNRLYVFHNHARITIYDTAVIGNGENAIDVIGQHSAFFPSFTVAYDRTAANNIPHPYGFNTPSGIVVDSKNKRLFVSDTNNHRVLVFNLASDNTLVDRVPDFVLGQANFTSNSPANSQVGMSAPTGLAYDAVNNRLFVGQTGNHRVTVYDVTTITNGENAVGVLGQTNYTNSSAATSATGMNLPRSLAYDAVNNRLFVVSQTSNRVTVYDVATVTNGESASNVLGQANFTASASANTAIGMNSPRAVAYDSVRKRLFVTQAGNNSVKVFDVASISDGEPAINVLGQLNFTATSPGNTQTGMNIPQSLAYDELNNRLFVGQFSSHRVTVYDVASITDGEAATHVLGQPDFTSFASANTQAGMNVPQALHYDPATSKLYVAQSGNHRVTVYEASHLGNGFLSFGE